MYRRCPAGVLDAMTHTRFPDTRIVVSGLTKQYRKVRAVHDLSFTAEPGRVTGFLGPNGAGKTTTLRMLLGLVTPTAGSATIGGRRYAELDRPLRTVGAVVESDAAHEGRTGRSHLRILCTVAGLPATRADEVLDLVGLGTAGRRKVRGYSLGMRQRLGIATALLGDPRVLVLDEPANGLDPAGIRWMRGLLRGFAAEGRTVLLSSHLLAETQLLADDVVIVAGGRSVAQGPVDKVIDSLAGDARLRVRATDTPALAAALAVAGGTVRTGDGVLLVAGLAPAAVSRAACVAGVDLIELVTERPNLEDAFFDLTDMAGIR
jgi:ABC-2 type transport system ATP-binding protein